MSLTKTTYSMIDGPVLNVKDFGAVGDGTNDDTLAIQAAVDELAFVNGDVNKYGKLVFPPGTYRVTDEIVLKPMSNCVIEGYGQRFDGSTTVSKFSTEVNISYDGTTSATKSIFRATASSNGSFVKNQLKNICLMGNGKAAFTFVIEGSAGATYSNTWQFYSVKFSFANKISVLIGSLNGTVDVDCYQVNFWECLFDQTPICVFIDAQNAYGPLFERCYFADTTGPNPNRVINYIASKKIGDIRIRDTFFSFLRPATTIVNPLTGNPVQDSEIYCMDIDGYGTIDSCHTEEARVLKYSALGTSFNKMMLSNLGVNDARDTDSQGRNLNWNNGIAAYSVFNEGQLVIDNCSFGGSTGAELYRKIYNAATLYTNVTESNFLGPFGVILHFSGSLVQQVNGMQPSSIPVSKNWALSDWQDSNILLDGIEKFNGASGVSTVTRSTSGNPIGRYTAEVVTTVAATTFCSGFRLKTSTTPLPKYMTLIVAGFTSSFVGLSAYRGSSAMTPVGTSDGNIFINNNFGDFVGAVSWSIDNTSNAEDISALFGLPANETGTYYYKVATFIPGLWTLADASAMLPFLGNNNGLESGNAQHYGTSFPTVGTFRRGDVVWNSAAASGQPAGWMCIDGSANTWAAMANLA
jgi:hypothetical protein